MYLETRQREVGEHPAIRFVSLLMLFSKSKSSFFSKEGFICLNKNIIDFFGVVESLDLLMPGCDLAGGCMGLRNVGSLSLLQNAFVMRRVCLQV